MIELKNKEQRELSKTKRNKATRKEKKEEKENQEILERKAIVEKIQELEKEGKFDVDAEDDPPTIPLEKDKVDYLNKKISSKSKTMFCK